MGLGFSSAFTWSRLRRVTKPLRRYQIPSAVSHTSSALIDDPSVSLIVTGPRLFAASTFVATGPVLRATRTGSALTVGVGVTLGEGDGEGDGEGVGVAVGDEVRWWRRNHLLCERMLDDDEVGSGLHSHP